MIVQPAREVDYREAKKTLVRHLKTKGMGILMLREWARWTYSVTPFWSVWGTVYSDIGAFKYCGIHIYDDGRVEIVCRSDTLDELEKQSEEREDYHS